MRPGRRRERSIEGSGRPIILAVDDTPSNLELLHGYLGQAYDVRLCASAEAALRLVERTVPDLFLLDVVMPGTDGYELCRRLKADARTAEVPVIFLTARVGARDEEAGFREGAVDYIPKPIQPRTLLARVDTHLRLSNATRCLEDQNHALERLVAERTADVVDLQAATILAMASLAETRDQDTGNHLKRTQNYVLVLAERLRESPRYASELDPDAVRLIHGSAPLHDIGKVGVPDRILLKPGPLDEEERKLMRLHTTYGRDTILAVENYLGKKTDFLRYAREIAYSHHERWDGAGYPEGLAGEAIPLSARMMAIVDTYDALISRRVYKPPYDHEFAIAEIAKARGTSFDPALVDVTIEVAESFRSISARFSDAP
jgi:putative two-component system response regulator